MATNESQPGQQVLATSKTTTPGATHTDVKLERLTVHIFF